MGIFAAAGICAIIWGEGILRTALGRPPDRSHPAFLLFGLLMVPGMLIGAVGGIPLCKLLYRYAEWQMGNGDKPDLKAWFKSYNEK